MSNPVIKEGFHQGYKEKQHFVKLILINYLKFKKNIIIKN